MACVAIPYLSFAYFLTALSAVATLSGRHALAITWKAAPHLGERSVSRQVEHCIGVSKTPERGNFFWFRTVRLGLGPARFRPLWVRSGSGGRGISRRRIARRRGSRRAVPPGLWRRGFTAILRCLGDRISSLSSSGGCRGGLRKLARRSHPGGLRTGVSRGSFEHSGFPGVPSGCLTGSSKLWGTRG